MNEMVTTSLWTGMRCCLRSSGFHVDGEWSSDAQLLGRLVHDGYRIEPVVDRNIELFFRD